jgi:hypothetical protein
MKRWVGGHDRSFVALFSLLAISAWWFADTVADPDLWGHIRFGKDIVRTGAIARLDRYSYRTAGQNWINHEWLVEVGFARLYDRDGAAGLIICKVAIGLVIVSLCFLHSRRGCLRPWFTTFFILWAIVPFRLGLGTVRPQMFTYLFFLVELMVLERARRDDDRILWALPPLFAIWVNAHGGVLAGVGALVVWMVARAAMALVPKAAAGENPGHFARSLGLLAACGLALCSNPYGPALLVFLLRTATVPRPEITEWAPVDLASVPGIFYLALVVIGIAALFRTRRPINWASIAVLSSTAILPLFSNRHYPLFAIALLVTLSEHIGDALDRHFPRVAGSPARRYGLDAAALIVSLVFLAAALPRFQCIRIEPYYFAYPARAVAFLERSGVTGNLAVSFDWGEYALWHLGPGVQVSVDGRRETVYSDESYRESVAFEQGAERWQELLATGTTDLVLLPLQSPATALLKVARGWVAIYKDAYSVIFARADFAGIATLVRTPVPSVVDDGRGLCFPD